MPLTVRPLPEEAPDSLGAHVLHFGDGFLDVLTGAMIRRAHEEEFNGPIGEPLALVDLVAQVQSSR